MDNIFQNLREEEFLTRFSSEQACLEALAMAKWADGFVCRKCGNRNYCAGKSPYSRRCTRCKTEESATANTFFHKCKISLPVAFRVVYLVCQYPDWSLSKISREVGLRKMTCWRLKKKISLCLENEQGLNREAFFLIH